MSESKHTSFIKLISPEKVRKKSQQYDGQLNCFSIQNQLRDSNVNPYDQQKTQRMRSKQYQPSIQMSPAPSHFYSSADSSQLQGSLIKLTNQIDLQKQAVNRANEIIDFLTEQNNKLNAKLIEVVKEFEATHMDLQQQLLRANNTIKQLQQKCSRNETAANSFIAPKYTKMTPIKIYGRGEDGVTIYKNQSQNTDLQQISKLLIIQNVFKIQKQLNKLNEVAQQQQEEIKQILQQQKYMQQYIQDEVLTSFAQFSSSRRDSGQTNSKFVIDNESYILQIVRMYQQQIMNWQHYANTLKKQLLECISFIESIAVNKDNWRRKQRQYTNQDLIRYICRQVCKIFNKRMAKNRQQTEQLKQILEELIDKIKKNQNPMLSYLS